MADLGAQRNYNLTDAELCMYTSNLCMYLTRDLSELSIFGVSEPKITALKALGDAFEVFPSDVVLLAYITGKTEEKNALLEQVKEQIRNMATRCQIKWGENSWQESSLGIKGMNQFTEDSLLVAARRVHEQMTEFLPDLGDVGLTQEVLDDFAALNESFEVSRNNLNKKIAERDLKTQERITKGNELYKFVSDYCEIGKRVYAKTNPAKYNDYVIYTPSAGGLTAPQNLRFSLQTMSLSWDAVTNATSYQLEADNGSGFIELYAGEETTFSYTPADGKTLYRVRARNANGFGDFSTVLEQYYYSTLPRPDDLTVEELGGYQFKLYWQAVPTATRYHIYQSVVEVGMPENIYSLLATVEALEFVHIFEPNRYTYLKYTASNEYQAESDFSRVNLVATGE